MRMNQKNLEMLLLVCIIVIAVVAYRFGYMQYEEKAKTVELQNKSIEAQVKSLQEKETHRAEFVASIAATNAEIQDILRAYGPGNKPEKTILFVNKLEEVANMKIPSVSFTADSQFFASSDLDENGNPTITADASTLTISYSTDYVGLKNAMDFINNYHERMNVASFNAVYDPETGGVSGSMIINMYAVHDEEHSYVSPNVLGIGIGKQNIFE